MKLVYSNLIFSYKFVNRRFLIKGILVNRLQVTGSRGQKLTVDN